MSNPIDNQLGSFLKDRRGRLDPAVFGLPITRRRTPGLRREEVASRADISVVWYTLIEQGRGSAPSAHVLTRVADALTLTPAEREHLFLLARRREPGPDAPAAQAVTPQLQRALDSLELNPALIKNASWDIVAWNRAAAAVLIDYAALEPRERNILRLMFANDDVRSGVPDWEAEARFTVARFRLETTRAGAGPVVAALVDELSRTSAEFAAIWAANDVDIYGEGTKHIVHPVAGRLELDYTSFALDGQPHLGMVMYTPATDADRVRIRSLVRDPASRA